MSPKTWFISLLIGIVTLTSAVGLVNFVVDPWQQYRKTVLYPVAFKNPYERSLNAGLAKHFPYRSMVIGTSMTENFLISDVARLMPDPIKLTLSGGNSYEMVLTMQAAFENRTIDAVLLGLDIFSFRDASHPENFPAYLYDDGVWNKSAYLFSIDTLSNAFKALARPIFRPNDRVYSYEHMYEFYFDLKDNYGHGDALREQWEHRVEMPEDVKWATDWDARELIGNFSARILPYIREHPGTTFYIFYPPYSRLMYGYWEEQGLDDDIEAFKAYVRTALGGLDNVRLYDFRDAHRITDNLDNYMDAVHYDQATNTWIVEQMLQDRYRVHLQRNN